MSAEAFAAFSNATFHDIDLQSELVDVSYGGAVSMHTVKFTDVNLRNVTGPIVSTSGNDQAPCPGVPSPTSSALVAPETPEELYLEYDDDVYDLQTEAVATSAPGQSRSLVVDSGKMSDCLRVEWTCGLFDKVAPPGCPAKALQTRSELEQARCIERVGLAATVDLDAVAAEGTAGEAVGQGCGDYDATEASYDPNYRWGFLDESQPWFTELQQARFPLSAGLQF